MNWEKTVPVIWVVSSLLLILGILVSLVGGGLRSRGRFILTAGFIALGVALGLDSGIFFEGVFRNKLWGVGWILSPSEPQAVSVGSYQDRLSYFLIGLTLFVSVLMLVNRSLNSRYVFYRIVGSLGIAVAGMSWVSVALTPWVAFLGTWFVIFAGLFSFTRANKKRSKEWLVVSRFAFERSFAFFVAVFGALILTTIPIQLFLVESHRWGRLTEYSSVATLGAVLLVSGLFLQMMSFPLLGWIVNDVGKNTSHRFLLTRVFPAWASFFFLIRLEPFFQAQGIFPVFGWVCLISCAFSLFAGLLQKTWVGSLSLWFVSGLSLACASLAMSGPLPGFFLLLGVSFSALIFSGVVSETKSGLTLAEKGELDIYQQGKLLWAQILTFFAAALGTGVIGSIGFPGVVLWLEVLSEDPTQLAIVFLILLFFVVLGWRLAWIGVRCLLPKDLTWTALFSYSALVVVSVAMIWTGALAGVEVGLTLERLFPSLILMVFEQDSVTSLASSIPLSGMFVGCFVLGFGISYWTSALKKDRWHALGEWMPRVQAWTQKGYAVEQTVFQVFRGAAKFVDELTEFCHRVFWKRGLPKVFWSVISQASRGLNRLDEKVMAIFVMSLRKIVTVPGKTLQILHTGDLRWYILFMMAMVFAIFVHYLRGIV